MAHPYAVPFPSVSRPQSVAGTSTVQPANASSLSLVSSRQHTALEVCDLVYGGSDLPSWDMLERLYEPNAIYENPFLTATSRSLISDIHSVSRQVSRVDIPKPLAVLYTLLRIRRSPLDDDVLFHALRAWTEIGDVSETESFDGHRKCIVEHTLNILLLPGLHGDRRTSQSNSYTNNPMGANLTRSDSSLSLDTLSVTPGNASHPADPSIPILGGAYSVPSPLHLQLRIVTRLSFNENGRITHHRDLWDVRDVLGLVPGASIATYIGTRLAAQSLSWAVRLGSWALGSLAPTPRAREADLESGKAAPLAGPAASTPTAAEAYARGAMRWLRSSNA